MREGVNALLWSAGESSQGRTARRLGKRGAAGLVACVALIWLAQSAAGLVATPVQVVAVGLEGIACGTHLGLSPGYLEMAPGSWLEVVNESPWEHTLHLAAEDSPHADPIARSPRIKPGGRWRVRLRSPGVFYLVSDNVWHHLAGLRGEIRVGR